MSVVPKSRPRRMGAVTLLVVGFLLLLLGSCSSQHVRIVEVWGNDSETRLDVVIASCNKDPTVDVQESIEEIHLRVQVQSRLELFSGDCLDGVSLELAKPLGERTVVDGATDEAVTVQPRE